MSKILVHIHTGPSDPNKVTLGALVAATAVKGGHSVTVFFAGDGVHNVAAGTRETLEGVGTGRLADHLAAVVAGGGRFVVSGMSAKARGYGDDLLEGLPAEFAAPDRLIGLAEEASTVLCY